PEDVSVEPGKDHPGTLLLGQATVERSTFVGASERLRLRLAPLPGTRAIAPPVPFGAHHILVEASRSQHAAQRFPLAPGDEAWVGVRHVHALAHPGLALALVADGTPAGDAALALGTEIARHAYARLTVVGCGRMAEEDTLRALREKMGGGFSSLETRGSTREPDAALAEQAERRPCDLAVLGLAAKTKDAARLAERALGAGEHHLLLVKGPAELPQRLLICVAVGEPGKGDVLFAGRLARHLGAETTVLTVLADGQPQQAAERFLAASVRSLAALGITAGTAIRRGEVEAEVLAELAAGHDLLVLGAPLAARRR